MTFSRGFWIFEAMMALLIALALLLMTLGAVEGAAMAARVAFAYAP